MAVTPFISIGMPTDAAVITAFRAIVIAADDDDGDAAGEDYDHDHDHEEVSKWVS